MAGVRRWLLPLSLAANVSLGTIVAMHFAGAGPPRHLPHPPGPPNFLHMAERMAEDLPAADGRRLIQAFSDRKSRFEKGHRAMGEAQDRIKEVLREAVVDPERLKAALDGVRMAREMLDEAIFAAVVEAAVGMSETGRRAMGARGFGPPPPPGR